MKIHAIRCVCALLLAALGAGLAWGAPKTFFANDFGAIGDGKQLETVALQKAIDKAAKVGGTVSVKPGTYLTGSLFLNSGVTLDLTEAATLIGSQKLEDY